MVRTYDPQRPVPVDAVRALLELAVRAPSAGFSQGWDFVVLHTADHHEAFWSATTPAGTPSANAPDAWLRGMRTAPVLVLCLSDPGRYTGRYAEPDKARTGLAEPDSWPVPYWDVDTGMAALLVLLGAVDAGLASCFFGVSGERHDAVRSAFSIPDDRRIVGVVSLGHPAPDGADRRSPSLRRGRRPLADVAHDGRFGVPL
jgi:nitroreductase